MSLDGGRNNSLANWLPNRLTGLQLGMKFGHGRKAHGMKLKESDQVWAPINQPNYLLVFPAAESLPRQPEMFLRDQVRLLGRLVADANPQEIQEANRRLELNLTEDALLWLPPGLLENPKCPAALLLNPAPLGTPLADWKAGIKGVLQQPPTPPAEARSLAEALSLEAFLSRLL